MSLEHPAAQGEDGAAPIGHNGPPAPVEDGGATAEAQAPPETIIAPDDVLAFWHALIDETAAAAFLGVEVRTMQKWRQTGEGPRYVALSSRCLRYRRLDLRAHSEARVRTSTSDPGLEAA